MADAAAAEEVLAKGDNHWLRGDVEKALLYFIRALELDNCSRVAASNIAEVHQQKGNPVLAEKARLIVLDIDLRDVPALVAVGLIKLEQRQYESAGSFFHRALTQYQLAMAGSQWSGGDGRLESGLRVCH